MIAIIIIYDKCQIVVFALPYIFEFISVLCGFCYIIHSLLSERVSDVKRRVVSLLCLGIVISE